MLCGVKILMASVGNLNRCPRPASCRHCISSCSRKVGEQGQMAQVAPWEARDALRASQPQLCVVCFHFFCLPEACSHTPSRSTWYLSRSCSDLLLLRGPTGICRASCPATGLAWAPGPVMLNLGAQQSRGPAPGSSAEPLLPQHTGDRSRLISKNISTISQQILSLRICIAGELYNASVVPTLERKGWRVKKKKKKEKNNAQ